MPFPFLYAIFFYFLNGNAVCVFLLATGKCLDISFQLKWLDISCHKLTHSHIYALQTCCFFDSSAKRHFFSRAKWWKLARKRAREIERNYWQSLQFASINDLPTEMMTGENENCHCRARRLLGRLHFQFNRKESWRCENRTRCGSAGFFGGIYGICQRAIALHRSV